MKLNQIINIGRWHERKIAVGYGTRAKFVLKRTNRGKVYFLAKTYEKNIGELRSEVCASAIGRLFGFSVQKTWFCEIPQYRKVKLKQYGVLIQLDIRRQRDTRRGQFREDLLHGAALLANVDRKFSKLKNETERRKYYKLSLVVRSLRYYCRKHPEATNVWGQFFELLAFDALIGGTDRHYNNWGILTKADTGKFIRLAPAFDNGIALMWKMDEYKRKFLTEAFSRKFVLRAESMFKKDSEGKFSLYEVLDTLYNEKEFRGQKIATNLLRRLNETSDTRIHYVLFKTVPKSKEFETFKDELNFVCEYVRMRLDVLKSVLSKLEQKHDGNKAITL